jgi:hypothetical protein
MFNNVLSSYDKVGGEKEADGLYSLILEFFTSKGVSISRFMEMHEKRVREHPQEQEAVISIVRAAGYETFVSTSSWV